MNLNSYLNSKPRGEMTRLAAAINEKLSNLSSMRHGKKTVPPYKCRRIVEATNGEVTLKDLRPDDWHEIWPELAKKQRKK